MRFVQWAGVSAAISNDNTCHLEYFQEYQPTHSKKVYPTALQDGIKCCWFISFRLMEKENLFYDANKHCSTCTVSFIIMHYCITFARWEDSLYCKLEKMSRQCHVVEWPNGPRRLQQRGGAAMDTTALPIIEFPSKIPEGNLALVSTGVSNKALSTHGNYRG